MRPLRLERYGDPTAARAAIERFVYEYNTQRPHQALDYVTPAAAHFGYADELRALRVQRREEQGLADCRKPAQEYAGSLDREIFPPLIPKRRIPFFVEP